jgi:hypothetical protein
MPETQQDRIAHCAREMDRGFDAPFAVKIQLRNRGYSDSEIRDGALLADKERDARMLEYGCSGLPEYGRKPEDSVK